jgi:hypothetical protein
MHRLYKLFCKQRSEIPPSLWTSYMNSSYKCPRRRRRKTPLCRSSAGMEQTNNITLDMERILERHKTLQELVGRTGKYTQEERLYGEAAAGMQQTTQTLDMERDP